MPKEYKKTTTLYLTESVVNQAKSLHINISETVEQILRLLISQYGQSEEEIKLAILQVTRDQWAGQLQAYEAQIEPFRMRLKSIDAQIAEQKVTVDEILRSQKIAALMKQLNTKIREADYDLPKIREKAAEEIQQLATFNITVDEVWLKRQIERIAQLDLH